VVKAAVVFVLGFMAGAAAAYATLGRPRATADAGPPATIAPAAPAAGSPPAAGFSPAGPVPAPGTETAAPVTWPTPPPGALWPPPPSPSPVPGDSTDHFMDPRAFAPPPDLKPLEIPDVSDLSRLRSRALRVPIEGFDFKGLRDNFAEKRGTRVHEAIDLLAPRGTPVLAVDDGVVKKLFTSAAGGLTVYQFDPSETYTYYYAHLDRYAEDLAEGKRLKKGDRVGYVGTTGNAPPGTPHLHFTIFKLPASKRWWEGTPINPYPLWALR
jgi:murein DD-endopeptidase MepM/ murein hydrolase activator NlpD